ncbi:hypothetical protein VFPPC_18183 [Pochonia chlamydosporia 170]|uniref:Uncharacterized protein n=1 Tax=Pochonia chlamydosporia 170 TaxID=1380566 RepID=A0A219AN85_METCM|nr:hypothetical protein VFPPC_18183 [Pochonia chlamydosporia 170]OWT42297.1 hypothetical protein VFPPC_18183 [Pochonia chlamydosporia 170]
MTSIYTPQGPPTWGSPGPQVAVMALPMNYSVIKPPAKQLYPRGWITVPILQLIFAVISAGFTAFLLFTNLRIRVILMICAVSSATSASGASEGFLHKPHRSGIPVNFKVCQGKLGAGQVFFREHTEIMRSFSEDVEASPLLQRAWVKQERLLSRRTIDFTSRQIYWTCRMARFSEDGQDDNDGGTEANALVHCLAAMDVFKSSDRTLFEELFFRAWADLLEEYSTLQLTYERDRLPGISGIATIGSQVLRGGYFSGIWEANLPDGLLWSATKYPAVFTSENHVPSWSWASVLGGVNAGGHDPKGSMVELRGTSLHKTGRQILHIWGRLHQCNVETDPQPPAPRCRSDRKLKDLPVEYPSYKFNLHAAINPKEAGVRFENTCIFDGLRDVESHYYALGVACSAHARIDQHYGILLRRLDDGDNDLFERVGRVWSTDPSWRTPKPTTISFI